MSERHFSRLIAFAALSVSALVGGLAGGALAAPATSTTGFVSRAGTGLVVNGKPWKFAGYNLPCANPFLLSSAELGYYLDDIKANSAANVVRMWWFQSNGGPGNWGPFDRVVAAAKARGVRIVATLTNEYNTCDEIGSSPLQRKDVTWYQSGYTRPGSGYPLSFKSFATQVATRYANQPTVAFWQLVNEAAAPTISPTGQVTCDTDSAMLALRSFSDTMAEALHGVDPHHLVDLGTGGGSCGLDTAAADRYVHAGALDLCEYHDYGQSSTAMPGQLQQAINDCHADGKPIYIGESGIPGNVQPDGSPESVCSPWPGCSPDPLTITTLDQRASFFKAKILAGRTAGLAGYLIWVDSPYYSPATDAYDIGDGDPTQAVLADALVPATAPVPTTPEAPWTPLLALSGLIVVAGALGFSRRRFGEQRH